MSKATAYEFVKIVQDEFEKGNSMAYYALLKGLGSLKVEAKTGGGHDYYSVIEEIHELQNEYPKRPVKQGYEEGLSKMARLIFDPEAAEKLVVLMAAELKYERDNEKSFKVDIPELIRKFQETIKRNYQQIKDNSNGLDFDGWLKERSEFIEKNYGHKL